MYPIHFLEGSEEAVEVLVRHALHLAGSCRAIDLMAPGGENDLGLLPVLTQLGLKPWVETTPDVFVFERAP
jgi:hypothetical protein